LKYGTLPELQQQLKAEEELYNNKNNNNNNENRLLRDTVTEDDIATIVSSWTGVPVTKLLSSEMQKLLLLQSDLDKLVIGQTEATKVVAEAIQRSRSGLSDPSKPIASFVFLGPTGVGKTELCKKLSLLLLDSEDAMVRIDMSEYSEQHSVSRLVGAPPGYVGYEEGGQLTEAVRRRPYCVLLLDEMEKAHPDVFNLLLQLLDDGRLTDSKGNLVNFRNTIVVFTSNIGSREVSDLGGIGTIGIDLARETSMNALKQRFRPEFLNRIDEFVIFQPLQQQQMIPIVSLLLSKIEKRLVDKDLKLSVTDSAKSWLAERGYDPEYGARPLKRTLQRYVETPIAKGILENRFAIGGTVLVHAEPGDDSLTITGVKDMSDVSSPVVVGDEENIMQ